MDLFQRHSKNPLISPEDIAPSAPGMRVLGVFNPGAFHDGKQFRLLVRIAEDSATDNPDEVAVPTIDLKHGAPKLEIKRWLKDDPQLDLSDPRSVRYGEQTYLSSLSHLRMATSSDGIYFTVEQKPFLYPETDYEIYGIEDARVIHIDGDWLINYTAVAPTGFTTALASTRDFKTVQRHGILFAPENKDVCLFPERIGGRYHCLHRPLNTLFKSHGIWYANSPNLTSWGNHKPIILPRLNGYEDARVGGGAPPIRTESGWLHIYHGANRKDRYSLFGALFDVNEPSKCIARSLQPIFEPNADYEAEGFFGGVVFTNGVVLSGDTLYLYYGAADTSTCLAQANVNALIRVISEG